MGHGLEIGMHMRANGVDMATYSTPSTLAAHIVLISRSHVAYSGKQRHCGASSEFGRPLHCALPWLSCFLDWSERVVVLQREIEPVAF